MLSGSTGAGGATEHGCAPAALLRGLGGPAVKSAALLSVSVQGLVRLTEVVLVVPGAGEPSAGVALLPNLLHPDRWLLWLGVLFIVCVYYFPTGIVGRLRR